MKFVRRHRHCRHTQLAEVHRNLADGLHGVGVDGNRLFFAPFSDSRDRLDNACFVIRQDNADEECSSIHRLKQIQRFNEPAWLCWQLSNMTTKSGMFFGCSERAWVLDT